jgi:hypothetical protein
MFVLALTMSTRQPALRTFGYIRQEGTCNYAWVGVGNRSAGKELRSWLGDRFTADNADIVPRQIAIVTPFQFQTGVRTGRGVPLLVPLHPQFGCLPPRHHVFQLLDPCRWCACIELAAPSARHHSKDLTFVCRRELTWFCSLPRVLSCLFRGSA